MSQSLRAQFFQSARAFAQTFRNPNIRRLELAWAASVTGEWSSIVALSVFAYDAGGPAAVGLVGLIRMLPSAIVAPFAALLSDRFRRERVMIAADLIRAVAVAAAAVAVFAQAPAGVVFALAGLVALVSTAFRPAQVALLPSLRGRRRSSRPQTLPRPRSRASPSSSARRSAGLLACRHEHGRRFRRAGRDVPAVGIPGQPDQRRAAEDRCGAG